MFSHGVMPRGALPHGMFDFGRIAAALRNNFHASGDKQHAMPIYEETYFESSILDRERYRL